VQSQSWTEPTEREEWEGESREVRLGCESLRQHSRAELPTHQQRHPTLACAHSNQGTCACPQKHPDRYGLSQLSVTLVTQIPTEVSSYLREKSDWNRHNGSRKPEVSLVLPTHHIHVPSKPLIVGVETGGGGGQKEDTGALKRRW
jgi:hypothetical protein